LSKINFIRFESEQQIEKLSSGKIKYLKITDEIRMTFGIHDVVISGGKLDTLLADITAQLCAAVGSVIQGNPEFYVSHQAG